MTEIEKLKQALPVHLYGINEANSFELLINEIKNKESKIIWECDRPIREVEVCRIRVFCKDLELYEDRQEFLDGRVRHRGYRGVSEKMFSGENPLKAAERGLKEELRSANLDERFFDLNPLKYIGTDSQEKISGSYPELTTRYLFYDYVLNLPINYWEDQYIEQEKDKRTYFIWKQRNI